MTAPAPDERAEIYAAGMRDLVAFRSALLVNDNETEVHPAPFHFTLSDILLQDQENFAIEGFRESAKTQYIIRAFLLYALVFPDRSRDYIVIIKNNATQARKKLKDIQDEYLSSPILSRGLVRINEQSSEVFNVDVLDFDGKERNIIIEAYGKGASIRGLSQRDRRPKLVLIDDPQDLDDCSPNSLVNEKDWEWFNSDILFLGKVCRVIIIANNLGERSIIERIFASQDSCGFKTLRIAIVDPEGNPTWPDQFPLAFIEKEKEQYRSRGELSVWLRERMCLAVADESRLFLREDFRYWGGYLEGDKKRPSLYAALLVDPAASIKESADYRACVLPGCDAEGNWFVLDISFGRYDMATLIDEIFRLVVSWKLHDVAIEEGVLKSAMEPFLIKEMKARQVFFRIIPLKAKARKEERIKLLQPRFKAHTIYFPEGAPWLNELESELLAFTMEGTKGLHDDIIDALAYFEQVARRPMSMNTMKNLPRNYLTTHRR